MNDSLFLDNPHPSSERYDTHVRNSWVKDNQFISQLPDHKELPGYSEASKILPDPYWAGHNGTIDCYWRAWELAFTNLKEPTPENDFAANYCDTAFNGNLFMWDSAFITGYGSYGRRAFNFQNTLDNFYRKQHTDGFICREISETDGEDTFHRFDPSSTGPNVMTWAEWNHYLKTGDQRRLEMVFPALVAYHQWCRTYRTWPDGSYWSTGWGSGMDNLPRVQGRDHLYFGNGHMSWVDATFQALLSARLLLQIAARIGRERDVPDLRQEVEILEDYTNQYLWNEPINFYCDRFASGELSKMKHIGAYWSLLAGCVPPERMAGLLSHLENPGEFNRLHRVPALSADDPSYSGTGGYWCGGVWAPTNFMVLKGLDEMGRRDLAHQIALNHLSNVVQVFESDDTPWTGAEQFRQFFHLDNLKIDDKHTLWEDYAADAVAPNSHSKPGYVGWTGLPPIAVLLEDVFGLISDAPANRLTWDIRLLEEHGVNRYPFGPVGMLDLICHARRSRLERPLIEIHSNVPLKLEMIWEGGREIINIKKETQ